MREPEVENRGGWSKILVWPPLLKKSNAYETSVAAVIKQGYQKKMGTGGGEPALVSWRWLSSKSNS